MNKKIMKQLLRKLGTCHHNGVAIDDDARTKEKKNVTEKPIRISKGITRHDIYVEVCMPDELRARRDYLVSERLIDGTETVIRKTLQQLYTASKDRCKLYLKVAIVMISDGSVSGALSVTDSTVGQAVVGLTWRLFTISRSHRRKKPYTDGMVVFRQQLEYSEFFDAYENQGERLVLERLAPKCAYNAASEIGVACTKFFNPAQDDEL